MAETETFQLNIGVLRSQMTLQIHTRQASRLWFGRKPINGKGGILGLNGFLFITNRINIGSRQDDPYCDWWMLQIEEKIDQVNAQLKRLHTQVNEVFASVPPAFTLGENLNVQPANLPVFAGSHLGYLAIFVLAQYDEIVRKALLAHHIALIDHLTLEHWLAQGDHWLAQGDHCLRSLFATVQDYRYSGINRKDIVLGTAAARIVADKFGKVPPDIMDGSRRSRFSPPLRTETFGDEEVAGAADEQQEQGQTLTVIVPVAADESQMPGDHMQEEEPE